MLRNKYTIRYLIVYILLLEYPRNWYFKQFLHLYKSDLDTITILWKVSLKYSPNRIINKVLTYLCVHAFNI